jgi:hypothetical protein
MAEANDRGPEFAAVVIVFLVITTLAVAARCFTRIFLTKMFSIEDWLSVLTLVSSPSGDNTSRTSSKR